MMIGLGLALTLPPASLLDAAIRSMFSSGAQGAWYDPSDFSTLFQDSAGTTPVTATGQPVGKILDKSGKGNHATQATATSRPLLQQDGLGYYYLNFDGVDDSLATGNINFTVTDKMTVFAGVQKVSDAATASLVELSTSSSGNNGTFQVLAPTGVSAANIRFSGKGTVAASGTQTEAANEALVFTGIADIAAPRIASRKNGAYNGSDGAISLGTGTFGTYPLFIGARSGPTLPFNGRLYGLVVVGAAKTDADIALAERYVGSKMGIAL